MAIIDPKKEVTDQELRQATNNRYYGGRYPAYAMASTQDLIDTFLATISGETTGQDPVELQRNLALRAGIGTGWGWEGDSIRKNTGYGWSDPDPNLTPEQKQIINEAVQYTHDALQQVDSGNPQQANAMFPGRAQDASGFKDINTGSFSGFVAKDTLNQLGPFAAAMVLGGGGIAALNAAYPALGAATGATTAGTAASTVAPTTAAATTGAGFTSTGMTLPTLAPGIGAEAGLVGTGGAGAGLAGLGTAPAVTGGGGLLSGPMGQWISKNAPGVAKGLGYLTDPLVQAGVGTVADLMGTRAERGALSDASKNYMGFLEAARGAMTEQLAPYSQAGQRAVGRYENLLQNPQEIYNTPGYQFRLNEGLTNLQRQKAAGGMLRSGATLADITRYAQDYATSEYDKALAREAPLISTGASTAGGLAGGLADLYSTSGQVSASRELGQGKATQDYLQTLGNIWGTAAGGNQ